MIFSTRARVAALTVILGAIFAAYRLLDAAHVSETQALIAARDSARTRATQFERQDSALQTAAAILIARAYHSESLVVLAATAARTARGREDSAKTSFESAVAALGLSNTSTQADSSAACRAVIVGARATISACDARAGAESTRAEREHGRADSLLLATDTLRRALGAGDSAALAWKSAFEKQTRQAGPWYWRWSKILGTYASIYFLGRNSR